MMTINRATKVFVDSNMIIFAADFHNADVFDWITLLYREVYIHSEVYKELLNSEVKGKVDVLIKNGSWIYFDPNDPDTLSVTRRAIYRERLKDVNDAFSKMNDQRFKEGKRIKTVSNIGEIATITACLMIGAGIICSNDFDIRQIVAQEDYRILIEDTDVPLVQDSAEDFCFFCYKDDISSRKLIRQFYKTVIVEARDREQKLAMLDQRFQELTK